MDDDIRITDLYERLSKCVDTFEKLSIQYTFLKPQDLRSRLKFLEDRLAAIIDELTLINVKRSLDANEEKRALREGWVKHK